MKRYVITGGPCVGKTTVLNILAERGFTVVGETARPIIDREVAKDGDIVPWKQPLKFQKEVALTQLWKEFRAKRNGIVFFDRGLLDGYAYSVLEKVKPPARIRWFAKNRYKKIFILDKLPFYETDATRREDRAFALAVSKEIRKAYLDFGYEVITVPVLPPEERTNYILAHL